MIRRIHLGLLVIAFCSSALAQPLYKWTEADGSITFSPEKPPASVDFEVINTSDSVVPSTIHSRVSTDSALSDGMEDDQGISQISSSSSDSNEQQSAAKVLTGELGGSNAESQILYSPDTRQQPPSGVKSMSFGSKSAQSLAAAEYATKVQHRCDDLEKRVVSLERRMRAKLTPEDMDNTVIHMTKYQRAFDQDCVK